MAPLTFRYTSVIKSEAAYVIRRLISRCLESKQPSRVGGSALCDVVSSFLCHTHTDGKDELSKKHNIKGQKLTKGSDEQLPNWMNGEWKVE